MSGPAPTATGLFESPRSNADGSDASRRLRPVAAFGWLRGLAPIVLLLAIWQWRGTAGSPYFPPPYTWWSADVQLWRSGALIPGVVSTIESFGLALLLATIIGGAAGFCLGEWAIADRATRPTLEFFRALPPAVVVPVFVLILGYTLNMTLVVVLFGSIWPILFTTRTSVRNLHPLLRDVAMTLHLGRLQTMTRILLPALLPGLLLGVRIAAPLALITTLLVEIIAGVPGLGSLLEQSQQSFQSAAAYGLVCVVGIIALAVNGIVLLAGRIVFRGRV